MAPSIGAMTTSILTPGPSLGLKPGELRHTSLLGLVRAIAADDKPELHRYREFSDAVEAKTGSRMAAQTYLMPADLLQRDMTVAGAGSAIVGVEGLSFVNTLAKRSILGRLPVQQHQELRANATITRMSGAHTTTWLSAEDAVISDGQSTYGQISLMPKSVAATVIASRQMLVQGGPVAEAFLHSTLANALAEAVDSALISGSGNTGQPLGIVNTSNIDTRAGTAFALADAVAMLKVADGYALSDTLQWVAGVDTAEDLRARPKVSGGERMLLENNRMLDQPLIVSRSAPAAGLVLMQWGAYHFAQWGALEVAVDPYTHAATGRVIVRALWRVDFAVEAASQVAVATAVT